MRSRVKQWASSGVIGGIALVINPGLFVGCAASTCEEHSLDEQVSWAVSNDEVARARGEVGVTHVLSFEGSRAELTLLALDVVSSPVVSANWIAHAQACITSSEVTSRAVSGEVKVAWVGVDGEQNALDGLAFSGALDVTGTSSRRLRLEGEGEGVSFTLVEVEPGVFALEGLALDERLHVSSSLGDAQAQ